MADGPPPEDFSKLPLEEKLSHKVWRARLMGYEEATKLFRRIDDEKSSEYNKFTSMMKKFVIETNAMAQEKALEATLAFVECAAVAEKTCEGVVSGIVTKCLSARPKTKQSGIDVCLMYTEIEQQAVVQEEISKGLSHKQPKIVTACVLVLRTMLTEFGAKVVNMKQLLKAMPGMFEHSDKNVRAEAKLLAIEVYRWMGAPLKGILEKSLKPVQMKELEEEWGKLSGEPAAPTRRLRSQQQQAAVSVATSGGGGGGGGGGDVGEEVGGASDAIDPYDLLDPVDVLSQLPKDFYTKIADTKWKERKEALDLFLPIAQSPKISPGDFTELMKALRKVITKDSNVMIVTVAGNVVAGLATGLRKSFQPHAASILSGILEKFKEKKLMVVVALRDAADAAYQSTTLGGVQEQILEALDNKNPSVKAETLLFLCRCFQQCTPAMLPKASLKAFCPPLIKQIDSADPNVREAAFESIATLLKVVGERPMNVYMDTIDKNKMTKIQEHKEKVELKIKVGLISSPMTQPKSAGKSTKTKVDPKEKLEVSLGDGDDDNQQAKPVRKKPALSSQKRQKKKTEEEEEGVGGGGGGGGANDSGGLEVSFGDDDGEGGGGAKPRKKKPVLSSTKNPPKRRSKKPDEEGGGGGGGGGEEEKASKPASEQPAAAKPAKKKPTASGKAGAKGGKGGGGKGKGGGASGKGDAPDPPEPPISSEELDDKANEVLPPGLLAKFEDAKWKDRLEACEKLKEFVDGLPGDEMHSLLMIKVLARKPGWKDSNFQVMKGKFAVISVLAERANVFGRKSTNACLPALVEKLGDAKVKPVCVEVLMLIAERMTLNFTSLLVMKASFEQKSPKVQSESLEWLKEAITSFGFLINLKPHIDFIKKGFGASNPAVRTSAMNLLSCVYLYVGGQVRVFFEDEKPALLKQIDEAFEKMSGQTPPAPTRGPNAKGDDEEEEEEGEEGGGGGGGGGGGNEPMSLADLMPKVDISGQIKSSLITELSDKNWKIRGEGLTKVQEILSGAKFIQPTLGELPGALKARLGDSNKNHIITTVNIIAAMATAMGSACVKFVRTFLPGVLQNLTDAKPHVRAACISCLNVWLTEISMNPLIEGELLSTALQNENPNLRTELLSWLEEKMPATKGKLPPEVNTIIPPIYSCLEDRNGEVRKKAQAVIPVVMAKVGYDLMLKQSGKLKGNSKQTVKTLLDKHRAASKPPSSSSSSSSSAASSSAKKTPQQQQKKQEVTEATKPSSGKATGAQEQQQDDPPQTTSSSATKKSAKSTAKTAKAGAGKQKKGGAAGEAASPPLVLVPNGKEQRMRDEDKMKVLKWNFNSPRTEHIVQLKEQLQPCLSPELFAQIFHEDFKQQLKALETLTKAVSGPSPPHKDAAIATLDLLLRWVTLRFFDTNTTVNMKCLDFLHTLFTMLISDGEYRLSDYEAQAFLPYLVQKVGDSKEPVRKGVRGLFRDVCSLYPPSKLFSFILDGLKSKNARQRTECLEELGLLIQNNGMVVCGGSPQKTVPLIAAQISDRDNTVRTAALNTFVIIYGNVGDSVYKYTSQLSEKDVSLLEEKIRRYGKKAPQATPPGPPTLEAQAPPTSADQPSSTGLSVAAGRGRGRGGGGRIGNRLGIKPASSTEKLSASSDSNASSHDPLSSPPLSSPTDPSATGGGGGGLASELQPHSTTNAAASEPAKPVLIPGPYKLDWRRYQPPQRPPPVKMIQYDRTVFNESNPPYPRFSTHSLLKNPPAPVVLSPPRLATTSNAINYIISQITSTKREDSIKALKQIENVITNTRYIPVLVLHVDHLLRAVIMQLRILFTSPLATADEAQSQHELMDHAKRLVSSLVAVFSEQKLATAPSLECLCEVETAILSHLCDERLLALEEVAQLNRAFNYLMYRICEKCEKTVLFSSLIRVMLKSISSDGSQTKLTELSMKCIWKVTRQIPQYLQQIKIDELLREMQSFFQSYGEVVPNPRPEDKPLRTAKTILFHLTEQMGPKITDHLSLVPEQSRVAVYIRKTLAKKGLTSTSASVTSQHPHPPDKTDGKNGTTETSSSSTATMTTINSGETPIGRSPFLHESLSVKDLVLLGEIINMINPETEYQGMKELYAFQIDHPRVDVTTFFSNQSQLYQEYIAKGLKLIEKEQQMLASGRNPPPYHKDMLASDFCLETKRKSRELREKASKLLEIDLEEESEGGRSASVARATSQFKATPRTTPTQDENFMPNIAPASSSSSSSVTMAASAASKASIGSANIEDYRRRLEKFKKGK